MTEGEDLLNSGSALLVLFSLAAAAGSTSHVTVPHSWGFHLHQEGHDEDPQDEVAMKTHDEDAA